MCQCNNGRIKNALMRDLKTQEESSGCTQISIDYRVTWQITKQYTPPTGELTHSDNVFALLAMLVWCRYVFV